ncbi:MAG TPA: PLD nuclease N-terminal domain-containing protein [Balneolales bacterium]|nr:PLD nuclease N-terminal domain-containing protein [Balneolales bacterium]
MLFGLIKLIILILDIVAVYDCLKSTSSTGKKLLWIAVIILLPFIGMVLYFWIGKEPRYMSSR